MGWNGTFTWCESGAGVMHLERKTAGVKLYTLIKDVLLRNRYCDLNGVFDEQVAVRSLYT